MIVFLCDYQVCTFSLSASTTFVYQWSGYSSNWDACFFWNVNLLTWQCFSAEMSVRATSLGAWGKFRLNWPDTQVFYFYEWSFGRCGQISNHVRTLLSAPSYWSSMPESAGFFLNCRRHGTVAVNCKLHGASICPHKWWSYVGKSECGNDASAPCGKAWIYAFRVWACLQTHNQVHRNWRNYLRHEQNLCISYLNVLDVLLHLVSGSSVYHNVYPASWSSQVWRRGNSVRW